MKNFKKGLSLIVALAMLLQVLSFVPVMAETVTAVELGSPAYVYNPVTGNTDALTDGDPDTSFNVDRRRLGNTWVSVFVFDAGEGNTYDFNRVHLIGTGARFYGANEEGDLLNIDATIDQSQDYSSSELFAETYGLDFIGRLENGNYEVDDYIETAPLSYRFFVVLVDKGWTNCNVREVSLELAEAESRTVTFGDNVRVSTDGGDIVSGDQVPDGTELTITPVLGDDEVLDAILVNGEPIDGNTYTVEGEDVDITVTSHVAEVKRTVTFGADVTVTADGSEIKSGDRVGVGATLAITPIVAEDDVLEAILVNGKPIEGDTYTVADEDIEITLALARKYTVTFASNVFVSVGGKTVLSGAQVASGKVLEITPVIPADEVLDSVAVNGTVLSAPYTYTVGEEDIEVVVTSHVPAAGTTTKLGAPVYIYNHKGGDASLMTDGSVDTAFSFGRGNSAPTWITAAVYDAGANQAFEFNKISLVGTGVAVYGSNEEGDLLRIDGVISETDHSADSSLFAEELGVDLICDLNTGNSGGEAEWKDPEAKSYRYIVIVVFGGWPNANVNEVTLELLPPEEFFEYRTVTFDETVSVTVDGEAIASGSTVLEGKTLEITPNVPQGAELGSILVNGKSIEGTSYVLIGDAAITATFVYWRTVTFTGVTVTADGKAITNGDKVLEGTVLTITPVLGEGQVLDQILVNGAGITGTTYTVAGEDVTIEVRLVQADPDAVQLGKAAYVYNIPESALPGVDYLTDGKSSTALEFRRNDLPEDTWISVIVYDAGEGKTFDFTSITIEGYDRARFYGTNQAKNGSFDLTDIAGTIEQGHDYSKDEYFAQCFGLTALADMTNSTKTFDEMQSYRYFVVAISDGWSRNTSISEITLSDKVICAELGEVIYAGGTYTSRSGQWSSNNVSGQWSVTDNDLGIVSGADFSLRIWGWIGGSNASATEGAGVITFKLRSDSDTYADVKIVGNARNDERDFAVWVTGEDGRMSQGSVATLNGGTDLGGGLRLYTINNIEVFEGINNVMIGSSQFAYATDYVMSVFVDKAASLVEVGEVKMAEGNEFGFGTLVKADSFSAEFFPGKAVGDELGVLPISDEITADVITGGGTYNLIALADKGTVTLTAGDVTYSAEPMSAEYSSEGGLHGVVIKNVSLEAGITSISLSGSDLVAFKLIRQRQNTVTYGDEVTVVADGKLVPSGSAVADGTTINITAYSPEGQMVDQILVNGKPISGVSYFVFGEDVTISATFTEIVMVTVTFDEGVVVMLDGKILANGEKVRGDATLRLSSGATSGLLAVYSVNGVEIEGSTYTLNRQDVHISVTLTPYDLIFLQDYEITLFEETETALRYLLPAVGEYGSAITWTLADTSKGDIIEEYNSDNYVLNAEMAANNYEAREIRLTAKITVAGKDYTVEKVVAAESRALYSIGGRSFYARPIGASEAGLTINDGQFALSGRGGDLWTAPDSFGYLYTKTTEDDITFSVRIDKTEGDNQWRRTGIMLRESAADNARFVMLDIGAQNGAGLELAVRETNGATPYYAYRDTNYVRGKSSFGYIKLEKVGSAVNAYYSENGIDYTLMNAEPINFALDGEYLIGLFTESQSGSTYFSRFEINGGDVLVSGSVEDAAYTAASGKLRLTWTDPAEYSTFAFESVVLTADCGDGNPVTVEVPKGAQQAVLEGLTNGESYTVTIQAKTALLCSGGENNAEPYNALGKAVALTAMPFDAAVYAKAVPELNMTLSDTVMVGERNRITLEFNEEQPLSAFVLNIPLPSGVSADLSAARLIDGAEAAVENGVLKITYSGSGLVKRIGTVVLTADQTGSYSVAVSGTASYYSFEDGTLTTENAALANADVTVIDVRYVTLTFDEGITATIDGVAVASGSVVRGDSVVELSCGVPENAEVIYYVNGVPAESSTVILAREDTHISYKVTPFDVRFVEELEIVQRTETEAGIFFSLPSRGEYESPIVWTLKDSSLGDSIERTDYDTYTLIVNMADNNYVSRSVELVATITFGGKEYTVEKTVYAQTNLLHELGGMNFFLRQIGQDDQSTATFAIENNQLALSGYGTDLWTSPDSFGYFYTKSSDADYTIAVKVDLQQGGNQWRRSGLMFRQSDSENEKMVMLDVGAGNGAALEFAYRIGTTGASNQLARNYEHANNVWLKLEKKGNKFYAYVSDDGEEYTLVSQAAATVTMEGDYLVGIFAESETGTTYFSRLQLNGDDVFVSNDITSASVVPSEGKIHVSWEDPTESGSRSYENILVTVSDGRRSQSVTVAKGVGEALIENLTNGVMYTVTVQARTAALCAASSENGATAYNALSAPITMQAFPVDIAYLAATRPVVNMSAKSSVVVGQSNKTTVAFDTMQPVYKLNMEIEIPDHTDIREKDVKLGEALLNAGGEFSVKDGVLSVKYEAKGPEGIIYITDIAEFSISADKSGTYSLKAEGEVTYYSFEIGELSAEISDKSTMSFRVESGGSSIGGSGGGSGSGSGGNRGGSTGGTGGGGYVTPGIEYTQLDPIPEANDIFVDKNDIPAWAATAIGRLTERGIISGITTGEGLKFMPGAELTREQFVKLCVEAFIKVDPNAQCSFSDVDSSAWYYPYIATMVQAGIIQGYTDGRFGVGDPITREDMAVILYKLYQQDYFKLVSGPVTPFADGGDISSYALEAVTVLRAAGVINGFENNTYAPKQNVSRAQAAQVIYTCLN